MRAQFIRRENSIENLGIGIQRRSIKNFDGPKQAFYYEIHNPYTKKDLSNFLETPYKEIYLIADQDDPKFPEMWKYINQLKRVTGTGNVSHQSFDFYDTEFGKIITGGDLVEKSDRYTIWGNLESYTNFMKEF